MSHQIGVERKIYIKMVPENGIQFITCTVFFGTKFVKVGQTHEAGSVGKKILFDTSSFQTLPSLNS